MTDAEWHKTMANYIVVITAVVSIWWICFWTGREDD